MFGCEGVRCVSRVLFRTYLLYAAAAWKFRPDFFFLQNDQIHIHCETKNVCCVWFHPNGNTTYVFRLDGQGLKCLRNIIKKSFLPRHSALLKPDTGNAYFDWIFKILTSMKHL